MNPTGKPGQARVGAIELLPDLSFDLTQNESLPVNLGKTHVPLALLPDLAFDLQAPPPALAIEHLGSACRIFIDLAYPDARSIPASKRPYREIVADLPIADFLPPAACAAGVCQDLSKRAGGIRGYEFRLGSSAYPHLKLRVQLVELHEDTVWVYSVDTHDGFHQATQFLDAEEAKAWRMLVERNRALKHQIEEALAQAGFLTPIRLLRFDLTTPTNHS